MDRGRRRTQRTLAVIGIAVATVLLSAACNAPLTVEESHAELEGNRQACADMDAVADDLKALDGASDLAWTDGLGRISETLAERAELTPERSQLRRSFELAAEQFSQAADSVQTEGQPNDQEVAVLDRTLADLAQQCSFVTG